MPSFALFTQLNQDFDNSSIEANVGITCDSITLFARHLTGLNARRPDNMRKDDNDMTLRLLHPMPSTETWRLLCTHLRPQGDPLAT